jgi:hypothetical protein
LAAAKASEIFTGLVEASIGIKSPFHPGMACRQGLPGVIQVPKEDRRSSIVGIGMLSTVVIYIYTNVIARFFNRIQYEPMLKSWIPFC